MWVIECETGRLLTIRALAVSAFLAAAAYATPVNFNKLTNTGVSGVGCIGTVTLTAGCSVVASGTITDNFVNPPYQYPPYQLVSGPAGSSLQTVAVTQSGTGVPGGWLADNTTSRWIKPNNVNAGMTDPAGAYVYTQTFTLASTHQPHEIVGRWAADNSGLLEFNGTPISSVGSSDFGTWTPFTINCGLVTGINTLTFTVMNSLSGPNQTPSGLRVEFATPCLPEAHEMTALSLMLCGFLLFGLKRRKANSVA